MEVTYFNDLLEFLNMRAQAPEVSDSGKKTNKSEVQSKRQSSGKPITSFVGNTSTTTTHCVLCKNDKHPLYVCPKFKSLSHDQMVTTLKEHSVCMNCPRPGHFVKQCKSLHHCHKCQKTHYTLLQWREWR